MYHSITFGDKNTWDDWHLVPSSRPVFSPPTKKTKFLDIPGADGSIDISESLTGYPVFNNREGSFEFIVLNGFRPWQIAYSDIMEYLHGKTMRAVLEDDPDYFYEGVFSINEWNSKEPPRSIITIDYSVGPYKWAVEGSMDDWKWDPFNFVTGVIRSSVFRNIKVTSASSWKEVSVDSRLLETAPVCPSIIVSASGSGMDVRYVNDLLGIDVTKHLRDGTTFVPDFIFYKEGKLYFKGIGTVSIDFRTGRL